MEEHHHHHNNNNDHGASPVAARDAVSWSDVRASAAGAERDQYHFKTPQGSTGSSKLRESIRCSKRRIIQQILVKLKQAEPSDDSEYQALRVRQLELHDHILALMTQVKSFATNLVALGHGSSLIGESSAKISTPQQRQSSTTFHSSQEFLSFDHDFPKGMTKVDAAARELAGTVLSSVVASLEKKLEAMITLKREMEDRENHKIDFDSAVRKLRKAKERGRPEDVVRRDVKLQAARSALAATTEAIVKKFIFYENARSTFIYRELQLFRELQAKFFTLCTQTFQVHEHPDLCDDDSIRKASSASTSTNQRF